MRWQDDRQIRDIVYEQGWNEESILIHALGFIEDTDSMEKFIEYLHYVQEEENDSK